MEPFIKSVLSVGQKSPSRTVSGTSVGVVIHSKVGPLTAKVTSPNEFLTLFTTNKILSKADHSSVHNAFFLSRIADVVVKRAYTTDSYPLKGINTGNVAYYTASESLALYKESTDIQFDAAITNPQSMWFQISNVLFYGSTSDSPFVSGADTMTAKGTNAANMTTQGLVQSDYKLVQLSVPAFIIDPISSAVSVNQNAINEAVVWINNDSEHNVDMVAVAKTGGVDVYHVDQADMSSFSFDTNTAIDFNASLVGTQVPAVHIEVGATNPSPIFLGSKYIGSEDTAFYSITNSTLNATTGFYDFILNIKDDLNGEQSYKMTNDLAGVSPQGTPSYFDYLNDIREDIIIIPATVTGTEVIEDTLDVNSNPEYTGIGKDENFIFLTSNINTLNQMAVAAASEFSDYEDSRIQLFTDAGWYYQPLAKMFESVAPKTKSLNCVSTPPSMKDKGLIKLYASAFNSLYTVVHANGGKDTTLAGFQIPIGASCYYIESVAKNATRNNKYAPTFSKVNGTISTARLFSNFNKSVRDELSEAHVNVLMADKIKGIGYINDNFLSDTSGSLVDEENNMRLINDVEFDISKLMESFYSRFNIETTRDKVETVIHNYFKNTLLAQNYTIKGYKVVCDIVENNTIAVQNNELRVSVYILLNNSIKYITLTTHVVPTLQ